MPRTRVPCSITGRTHVTEVPFALGADNLDPHAVLIGSLLDGAFNSVVESRPAAAAVELRPRVVEWSVAADARVRAFLRVFGLVLLLEAVLQLSFNAFRVAGWLAAGRARSEKKTTAATR